MDLQPICIEGRWTPATPVGSLQAMDPRRGAPLPQRFPVSGWRDLERAVTAGVAAAEALTAVAAPQRAAFLERAADGLLAAADAIVAAAAQETALPAAPRLSEVELPRAVDQLRQMAAAVRDYSWCEPTLDTRTGIRSCLGSLGGPVAVFGPNNFPIAFNAVAGGDFAAAIAAGNPVIAKAHPGHPETSRRLAAAVHEAALASGMPAATVQFIYHMEPADGLRLVAHPDLGGSAFTGSRRAGLALKAAADAAGKPIYLELGSINPVFLLPGALAERATEIAAEYAGSLLLGSGQFCTNPGLTVLLDDGGGRSFVAAAGSHLAAAPVAPLLGPAVRDRLTAAVERLRAAGAAVVIGGRPRPGPAAEYENTLLQIASGRYLEAPEVFQEEAFGNVGLLVLATQVEELEAIARSLGGNLTGTLYSASGGEDDALYARLAPHLRRRVGRLLNDQMPTGVAVSPAMGHGGPYPASGHPGFTAVGVPGAIHRFTALHCYDRVRPGRLPPVLRDHNLPGRPWRRVDGTWTRDDVGPSPGRP